MKSPAKVKSAKGATLARANAAKPAGAKPTKSPEGPTTPTKQDVVLKLLRKPGGASIAAVVKATSWQPHSVRGFLAGVVRKKLGLKLVSEKLKGERRYRIEQ